MIRNTAALAAAVMFIASGCSRSVSQAAAAPRHAAESPAAPKSAPAAPSSEQSDPHAPMIAQMKSALVGHARFDGAPITDFRSQGACRAEFVTNRGATVINWREVGNVAGRLGGGAEQTALVTAGVTHQLSVPTDGSSDAEGVGGAVGQLAEECGAVGGSAGG